MEIAIPFTILRFTGASSQTWGLNFERVNYIFRTIDNVFLVYNETRYTDGVFDGRANKSLVLKVTYSVHP